MKNDIVLVVLLAGTIAACDTTSTLPTSQRDVYSSIEDCIADWGDTDMCEKNMADAKEAAEAAKIAAAQNPGFNPAFIPIFLGPSYSPGERYANYNGQRYIPSTQRAVSTSTFVRNPKTGVASAPKYSQPSSVTQPSRFVNPSPSTPRGGFGSTGASKGGSSAS